MEAEGRKRFSIPYMWLMAAFGVPIFLYSASHLPSAQLDSKFLILAVITVFLGSRVGVEIPHIGGRITVADTLIFLTMLCYGGEAAIILAILETLFSSLRICKRPLIILFNTSMMACSTFITVRVIGMFFGPIFVLRYGETNIYILAVSVMALAQYVTNSGLVAVGAALKTGQPATAWTKEDEAAVTAHFERLKKLTDGGEVILAGRTLNEDESAFGIVIVEVVDENRAREIMTGDPSVVGGVMTA